MFGLTHEGNRLCNAEIADRTNNQHAEHARPVADEEHDRPDRSKYRNGLIGDLRTRLTGLTPIKTRVQAGTLTDCHNIDGLDELAFFGVQK